MNKYDEKYDHRAGNHFHPAVFKILIEVEISAGDDGKRHFNTKADMVVQWGRYRLALRKPLVKFLKMKNVIYENDQRCDCDRIKINGQPDKECFFGKCSYGCKSKWNCEKG